MSPLGRSPSPLSGWCHFIYGQPNIVNLEILRNQVQFFSDQKSIRVFSNFSYPLELQTNCSRVFWQTNDICTFQTSWKGPGPVYCCCYLEFLLKNIKKYVCIVILHSCSILTQGWIFLNFSLHTQKIIHSLEPPFSFISLQFFFPFLPHQD